MSVYRPALTYGHELWVMTERVRSRVQAAEMQFLRSMIGLSLLDRVRSSDIREFLEIEPLLLWVERSQLRWFGHLIRMPPDRLVKRVFRECPIGRRPRGRPRMRWRDYIATLAEERRRDTYRRSGGYCTGKGCLGRTTKSAAPATLNWISGCEDEDEDEDEDFL